MIDEDIVKKIKNSTYRNIEEVFADFPSVEHEKILFHVQKHAPDILNSDDQSDSGENGLLNHSEVEGMGTMKKSAFIKWCKSHPLFSLDELSVRFEFLKPATLRSYRNEALHELIPPFTDFFISSAGSDDLGISDEMLRELIRYIIIRPNVRDNVLRKNFPDVGIAELKNYRNLILRMLKKYVSNDDSADDPHSSACDNMDKSDHASSLSLDRLKEKIAKHKPAKKLASQDKDVSQESRLSEEQFDLQLKSMQSDFKRLISISENILERVEELENIFAENLELKNTNGAESTGRANNLMQMVLGLADSDSAGVVGALIGGVLRGTGSVNIDFGGK